MNATSGGVVEQLLGAGLTSAQLARAAGVHRSSAARWRAGAKPRGRAATRLALLADLIADRDGDRAPSPGTWLDAPNKDLAGLTPAAWIADGRDTDQLRKAWQRTVNPPSQKRPSSNLAATLAELDKAAGWLTRIDMSPVLESYRQMERLSAQIAWPAALVETSGMVSVLASANRFARTIGTFDQLISEHLRSYTLVFDAMSTAERSTAFGGLSDLLRGLESPALMIGRNNLAAILAAQNPTAIGGLGAALELHLSSPIQSALAANGVGLRRTFLAEAAKWRSWLPEHPGALIRSDELEPEWLAGLSHAGIQTSVAALHTSDTHEDQGVVAAAGERLFATFPELLDMQLPGGRETLRQVVNRLAPAAVEPLEGGLNRLASGGLDAARQGAVSLRAGLDAVWDVIAPGPKRGRHERLLYALGANEGSGTGKLICMQVQTLYLIYGPLSDAVHAEVDLHGARTFALSLLGSLAAVLAQWLAWDEGQAKT